MEPRSLNLKATAREAVLMTIRVVDGRSRVVESWEITGRGLGDFSLAASVPVIE